MLRIVGCNLAYTIKLKSNIRLGLIAGAVYTCVYNYNDKKTDKDNNCRLVIKINNVFCYLKNSVAIL